MTKSTKGFEIDLVFLTKELFRKKYSVILFSFTVCLSAFILSYLVKDEFESKTTLYSNTTSIESDAAGLLKSLGGIEIANSADEIITKELILRIASSNNFLLTLSQEKIHTRQSDTLVSVADFLESGVGQEGEDSSNFLSSGLSYLRSLLSNKPTEPADSLPFMKLGYAEVGTIKTIKERVLVGFKEGGFIELTVMMPDPLAAASFAQTVADYLKKQVILFKTEKLTQDLVYVKRQYERTKKDYESAQAILAEFDDMNQNIVSTKVKNQREKLSLDLRLKSEVYLSLAKKYEQLGVNLRESTPLFLTLEPVYMPEQKSNISRKLILILSFGVGIILSIGFIAFRPLLTSVVEAFR